MVAQRYRLLTSVLCLVGLVAVAADWETDFEKAKAKAERDGKFMLIDFSGSDWCGWCMKLDKEVFSKNDFKKYAKESLVLVLLDFPHGKKLSKKETAQNESLRTEYGVRGYPTVVLALPSGEEVARTGYQPGGAEKYVEHLRELLTPHQDKLPEPAVSNRGSKGLRSSPKSSGKAKDKGATGDREGGSDGDGKRQGAIDKAL